MSFDNLKENGVTVLQMRELEEDGVLQRFARGWYWCNACDYEKPADYKYIEISKVNPGCIICLDSACFLCGMNVNEPKTVKVATARDDRKKMEIDFPIKRYYLTHMETTRYIQTKRTEFGTYRYFASDRALYDCMHGMSKIDEENTARLKHYFERYSEKIKRYEQYFKKIKKGSL